MSYVQDKIYDFVMDNVEATNRTQAINLLNDAFNRYEDGDLSIDELWAGMNTLIELAQPEKRPELEKMMQDNRGLIEKYFARGQKST
ncbi:MAG: hypothetical protein FWF11_01550 [Coriobacteriia bacterium]|nr:hypothetical protein [Coriobacteriia bacterium]